MLDGHGVKKMEKGKTSTHVNIVPRYNGLIPKFVIRPQQKLFHEHVYLFNFVKKIMNVKQSPIYSWIKVNNHNTALIRYMCIS